MPRYYCEYCDIALTHSSVPGRKQHHSGRKHIMNVIEYWSQFQAALPAPRPPPRPGELCSLRAGAHAIRDRGPRDAGVALCCAHHVRPPASQRRLLVRLVCGLCRRA